MNTSANSFVTLKDIADELGVNYKTLLSCKQRFNDYILTAPFGRTARYGKEWADFFKLTFALLDEGYQTDEIKKLLDEGVQDEKDEFIKEWIDEWRAKVFLPSPPIPYQSDGRTDGLTDGPTDGPNDGLTDGPTDGLTDGPADGLTEYTAQIRTDILAHLHPTITNLQAQLTDLTSSLPSDLVPQINAALTQFYKFAMELSARLERLEKELGLELQPMETELDLQSMQIDQDEPVESYVHADLEFVRASIFEGKPDKESVRQWLQRERQENPGLSYATLAETLNLAGIPTLSGRDIWNRGTLRNLLTER